MPIKFLHTADIHLGARFLGLGDRGAEQRKQLLDTLGAVVDLAVRERVDLALIAGDLFDSHDVSRTTLSRVASMLERLTGAGITVCVAPGTHDPFGPTSVYSTTPLSDMPGLHVFDSEEMRPLALPEIDCTVYGNANMRPFENKYPLAGFRPEEDDRWRIGMLHANFEIPDVVEDTYVVTPSQIASSGLDYIALGHLHSLSDRSSGGVAAYYSGSPEMVKAQKGGFGSVLLVELDEDVVVRRVPVGRRSFEEVTVQAESIGSGSGLVEMLEKRADPDRVLKITIDGLRRVGYPDMTEIVDELSQGYFFVLVSDRSRPAPPTVDPASYPADSPAGVFLRLLDEKLAGASAAEEDEVLEAMQVGLSLLEEAGD